MTSHEETSTIAAYATYEVTMPVDDESASLALHGLGTAFNWKIRQRATVSSDLDRAPLPETVSISDERLNGISEALWGTADYGVTAGNLLAYVAREFKRHEWLTANTTPPAGREVEVKTSLVNRYGPKRGKYDYSAVLGKFPASLRDTSWHRKDAEQSKIQELVDQFWPHVSYPFASPLVEPGPETDTSIGYRQSWMMQPGPVVRERLGHYLRSNGIDRHTRQGSIGKAFNTLIVAAGLRTEADIAAEPVDREREFIDYNDFRQRLQSSGLSLHGQAQIRQAIEWNLNRQLRLDQSELYYSPDVVVEGVGGYVRRGSNYVPHFDKIAVESLAGLFSREPDSRHVASRAFLKQFV